MPAITYLLPRTFASPLTTKESFHHTREYRAKPGHFFNLFWDESIFDQIR